MINRLVNWKKNINKFQKGFTLVELLIVIAIIGVLAALLMANFIGVRQRARDAQRKSDLKQIQSALELYRSDLAAYPITNNFPACGSSLPTSGTTIYMQKVPCDPSSNYNGGNYSYTSDGSTYSLAACAENSSDSQATALASIASGVLETRTGCTSGYFFVENQP